MASMTMTTSLAGGSVAALTKVPAANRRGVVMVKASSKVPFEGENVVMSNKKESNNSGRRELFFAMAAIAASSVAKAAMAEEPKRGSPEAKKKYYQVCVSNPTARICHNAN